MGGKVHTIVYPKRLAFYVGIEVVFIAPSRPGMNGTIEEFNKGFDKRFWQKEQFTVSILSGELIPGGRLAYAMTISM